jgi:pyruvate/2-oxoglutarate dehydrogenase complex dihydrolipoamide acyltransferase (E2) component
MLLKLVFPYYSRIVQGGKVSRWHKAPGDRVDFGEDLLEVAVTGITSPMRPGKSASITIAVTSSAVGVLRSILVPEGGECQVGEPVAVLSIDPEEPLETRADVLPHLGEFHALANPIVPEPRGVKS